MGAIVVCVVLGSSLAVAGLLLARAFPHSAWWVHDLMVSSGLAFVAVGLAMWILPRVWSDAPQRGLVFIWGTATVAVTLVLLVVIAFFDEPTLLSDTPTVDHRPRHYATVTPLAPDRYQLQVSLSLRPQTSSVGRRICSAGAPKRRSPGDPRSRVVLVRRRSRVDETRGIVAPALCAVAHYAISSCALSLAASRLLPRLQSMCVRCCSSVVAPSSLFSSYSLSCRSLPVVLRSPSICLCVAVASMPSSRRYSSARC